MPVQVSLNTVESAFQIDNLKLQTQKISFGVFHAPCTRHCHGRHFYEAHLIYSGKGTLIANGSQYPLVPGDFYMTGPNIDHGQLTDSDNPMAEYCLSLEIRLRGNLPFTAFSSSLYHTHFWFGKDQDARCLKLFQQLEQEALHRSIGYAVNVQSIVSSILVELVRNYTDYAPASENSPSVPDSRRMLLIDHCFLSQYNTITEERLSRLLNLSTRQLQRFLKENYGKTFTQMKKNARLNKGAELLEQGFSLEEAAARTGYEDISHFRKLMTDFRQKQKTRD